MAAVSAVAAGCDGDNGSEGSDDDGQGGSTGTSPTTTSGGGSNGSGGAAGAGGSGGGEVYVSCPDKAPAQDEPCTDEGRFCTYGDHQRPDCRTKAICGGGIWSVIEPTCKEPPAGTCSGSPPDPGALCPSEEAVCAFSDGTLCECATCHGMLCGPEPTWACGAPAPGCPLIAPNSGTACSMEGQSCVYGDPCAQSGAVVNCQDGSWSWAQIACGL
jgi:hypothetical protein